MGWGINLGQGPPAAEGLSSCHWDWWSGACTPRGHVDPAAHHPIAEAKFIAIAGKELHKVGVEGRACLASEVEERVSLLKSQKVAWPLVIQQSQGWEAQPREDGRRQSRNCVQCQVERAGVPDFLPAALYT